MFALQRDGDEVRRASLAVSGFEGVQMSGEIGRGGVHELHELGVGAVCCIDDRGLARALLGEARGAGIGKPRFESAAVPVL